MQSDCVQATLYCWLFVSMHVLSLLLLRTIIIAILLVLLLFFIFNSISEFKTSPPAINSRCLCHCPMSLMKTQDWVEMSELSDINVV